MMEPISLDTGRKSTSSWWIGQQQPGFTATAAKELNVTVPVDFLETEERAFVQRRHMLSALLGARRGTRTFGVMHANVVSRN